MVSTVPVALQLPWCQKARITSTQGINATTIALAGYSTQQTTQTKIIAVTGCNNDTIAHDVQIGIADALGFTPLGTVTVPIGAGYIGTVPSVNLLNSIALALDETGQSYIYLNPTDILQVKLLVAVSSGKEVDFICMGADF